MMPVTAKMRSWREGHLLHGAKLLTTAGLREILLLALDHDEARVDFVCRQVEETGAYELEGDYDLLVLIEKILHA